MIKIPQKGEYIRFKNYERELKPLLMISTDFESILVSKDNGKQNPDESFKKKNLKHVACSCG